MRLVIRDCRLGNAGVAMLIRAMYNFDKSIYYVGLFIMFCEPFCYSHTRNLRSHARSTLDTILESLAISSRSYVATFVNESTPLTSTGDKV